MDRLSLLYNKQEPQRSVYSDLTFQATNLPTTPQVLMAYKEEVLEGDGSLAQDQVANEIERLNETGTPLNRDAWTNSQHYREGLTWYEGLTEEGAKVLAESHDDRFQRQAIMERASGLQTVGGFGSAMAFGLFEPKNMAAGVAVGLFTAGAGYLIPTVARATRVATVAQAARRGAAEGVLAAAITEPSNIDSSQIVQSDYTMVDSLANVAFSAIFGAGFSSVGKGIELKDRARRLEGIRNYRAAREDIMRKEFDTALAQTIEGRRIDIEPVEQLETVDEVRRFTTLTNEQFDSPSVRKTDDGKFEATYPDETGVAKGGVGRGTTQKEAIDNLESYYDTPTQRGDLDELRKAELVSAKNIDTLENRIVAIAETFDKRLEEAGYPVTKYNQLKKNVEDIQSKRAEGRINVDKDKVMEYDLETQKLLTSARKQLDDFVSKNNPDILRDVSRKLQQDVEPLRQEVRNLRNAILDNRKLRASREAGPRVVNKLDNKLDSGSYTKNDLETIAKEQENIKKGDVTDEELQLLEEGVAELEKQGLLTQEELDLLDKLDRVTKEVEANENVLNNAKLCLLRQ